MRACLSGAWSACTTSTRHLDHATGMANEHIITDPALQSVLQAAANARQQSMAILDLLQQYHGREGTPAVESSLDEQLALSKQQKLLTAHLAQLRGLNRKAILSVRSTKQETAEARQEIDSLHLQLQNLYYEQRHLRGEIAGCEEYKYAAFILSRLLGVLTILQPSIQTIAHG